MKILHGSEILGLQERGVCLTIGSFDGVHLGHRELIGQVILESQRRKTQSVVMTFDPHPAEILYPEKGKKRLFPSADQTHQLKEMGVNVVALIAFSRDFSEQTPLEFFENWVWKPFAPSVLVVGYDFAFGAHREGSHRFLEEQAQRLGFHLVIQQPIRWNEEVISSSRIRKALEEKDMELVRTLLGRPFYLDGIVVRGAGRGNQLGISTANLETSWPTIPPQGVYAGWAYVRNKPYPALMNIGTNPTFVDDEDAKVNLECHLLEFQGNLYGEHLKFEFLHHLRDEKKFSSAKELVEQIQRDIERTRKLLKID